MIYSEAYRNGWLAHRNNVEFKFNPYKEFSSVHPTEFSFAQWNKGYNARKDFKLDLTGLYYTYESRIGILECKDNEILNGE
jgi:hypothetical protein